MFSGPKQDDKVQLPVHRVSQNVCSGFHGKLIAFGDPVTFDLDELFGSEPERTRLRQHLFQHRFHVLLAHDVLDDQLLDDRVRAAIQLRQETQTEGFVEGSRHRAAGIGRCHGQGPAESTQTVVRLATGSVDQAS